MRRDLAVGPAVRLALLKLGDDLGAEARHVIGCRDCFEIVAGIARREFLRLADPPGLARAFEPADHTQADAAFFDRFHFMPNEHHP